ANAKPGKAEASWKIQLPPGSHRLSVLARSAVSTATANEIELTYEPMVKPDLRPKLYVLSVGIDKYRHGDWKLKCAVNDASKISDVFLRKGQTVFGDVQAKLLTDDKATRQDILAGLLWLKSQMQPKDVAVIFFAGHGITNDKGKFFLLPAD